MKLEFYLGSDYKVQCTVWYFFLHLYSQDRPYLPCRYGTYLFVVHIYSCWLVLFRCNLSVICHHLHKYALCLLCVEKGCGRCGVGNSGCVVHFDVHGV